MTTLKDTVPKHPCRLACVGTCFLAGGPHLDEETASTKADSVASSRKTPASKGAWFAFSLI